MQQAWEPHLSATSHFCCGIEEGAVKPYETAYRPVSSPEDTILPVASPRLSLFPSLPGSSLATAKSRWHDAWKQRNHSCFYVFFFSFPQHTDLDHLLYVVQLEATVHLLFLLACMLVFWCCRSGFKLPVLQYACQYLKPRFHDHLLEMLMMSFFFSLNAHPPISAGEDVKAVKPRVSQH